MNSITTEWGFFINLFRKVDCFDWCLLFILIQSTNSSKLNHFDCNYKQNVPNRSFGKVHQFFRYFIYCGNYMLLKQLNCLIDRASSNFKYVRLCRRPTKFFFQIKLHPFILFHFPLKFCFVLPYAVVEKNRPYFTSCQKFDNYESVFYVKIARKTSKFANKFIHSSFWKIFVL